ncbi:hypothetical protein LRM33_15600 [Klebsiella pneumoniae]|nr:hypothetical protein [Klebsiella pneumoniae]UNE90671.1 hypothetical protein LRM33_15600 [Klebsiella pneumoniae]UNE96304.1 hypothetical protein LRM34_15590 [Klebsiella pneumoniae]
MAIKSIKLNKGISDSEFVFIGANACRHERSHLLGLLRIYIGTMKNKGLTSKEVYESLENWIKQRELIANGRVNND